MPNLIKEVDEAIRADVRKIGGYHHDVETLYNSVTVIVTRLRDAGISDITIYNSLVRRNTK